MNETDGERWAVIGGGLLGMTLALRLRQRGHSVALYEKAPRFGGLADAWRLGDVTWDRHYHVTLQSDTVLRRLLVELGLEREMRWVQTRTGFFTEGELHSMSNSLEFLRFRPLGLAAKARLAATVFYVSKIKNWRHLEEMPVEAWLRKLSGNQTTDTLWLPLLRAKLGDAYRKTSAAFIWATIARMYAARRSGMKREMFGYVRGGYGRINESLHAHLQSQGIGLYSGAEVVRVAAGARDRVSVRLANGGDKEFDRVVLTVPAPIAARICPDLSPTEIHLLEGVEYQGIVCASVVLDKPLAGYYITNITDSWVPFTAVIEASALIDKKDLADHTLVYLPRYLSSDDPAFSITDEEWRRQFLDALLRMYPHLRASDVLDFRVSRERFVYALPTIGYSRRLPPKKTSVPGVHIVNSAHIVNGTLNVNETVKLAEDSMRELLHDPVQKDT